MLHRDKRPGKVVIQGDPHSFAAYKMDRATHDYLHNVDNRFWQRFLEHHRPYLGKYWQRVIERRGFDVFRSADELRWGWIVGHERWSSLESSVRVGLAREREVYQKPDSGFRIEESAEPQAHAGVFEGARRRTCASCHASELRVLPVRERSRSCRGP